HVRVGHRQAYTAKPQISDGLGFFYASKKICIGGFNPSLKTAICTNRAKIIVDTISRNQVQTSKLRCLNLIFSLIFNHP
ncbi:MAG: hypothetical protein RBR45_09205, partial [Pseudomonas sp.]|nr:hypothetical protein [Pseudomonas sp.]